MGGSSRLPEGEITIDGVIIESRVDLERPTVVYLDILSRDPYTGENIRLDNIILKQQNPMMPAPVKENLPVKISAKSYESYRKRQIPLITATVAPESAPIQNKALPQPVKVKSQIDSFSSKPTGVCKSMDDKVRQVEEEMGLIHKRDDITLIQGKNNGSSPGMIIHQGNGDIIMFDANGKQYMSVNNIDGIKMSAGTIDSGSAKQNKNSLATGGMSAYENPVSDILPQGTILTPHPKVLPDVTRIVNTILPILDLIDLGKACMEAKKVIYDSKSDKEKKKRMEKIKKLEEKNQGSKGSSSAESYVVNNNSKYTR